MIDELKASPCVRSGFCCKTAICGFGEPNEQGGCKYLLSMIKGDGYEFYECGRHDWIIQQPGHEGMPAFGAGCCMTLSNELRSANIMALMERKVKAEKIISSNWFNKKA